MSRTASAGALTLNTQGADSSEGQRVGLGSGREPRTIANRTASL